MADDADKGKIRIYDQYELELGAVQKLLVPRGMRLTAMAGAAWQFDQPTGTTTADETWLNQLRTEYRQYAAEVTRLQTEITQLQRADQLLRELTGCNSAPQWERIQAYLKDNPK